MAYFEPLYGYIPVSVTKKKYLKLSQTEKKQTNGYQKYVLF